MVGEGEGEGGGRDEPDSLGCMLPMMVELSRGAW